MESEGDSKEAKLNSRDQEHRDRRDVPELSSVRGSAERPSGEQAQDTWTEEDEDGDRTCDEWLSFR